MPKTLYRVGTNYKKNGMKNLKIALFGLVFLAVATLGSAFKASAQSIKYATFNSSTTVDYNETNTTLIDLLGDDTKWNATSFTNPNFTGSPKVAAIRIDISAGDPAPDVNPASKVNFYAALELFYRNNGDEFPIGGTPFNVSAVTGGSSHTYVIRVQLKN